MITPHFPITRLSRWGLALVGLLLSIATVHADDATPWPVVGEGIEVDPSLHWGRLDNGLRYVIKRQPHPAGSASFRMVVLAGSLHEQTDEVGIAHFVEHMAFNDTKKFRRETIGPKLAAAGIRFGPEVNAFTFPSHTIYHLDLTAVTRQKLNLVTTVLREWASEIRFTTKQVEREKGVIRSEYFARQPTQVREYVQRQHFLYPNSLLSQRPPVTNGTQIESVTPARLKAFYKRWYRPDNTIIVAAGDFEADEIERLITQKFGNWKRPAAPLPTIDIGNIANSPKTRAVLMPNPEAKAFAAVLAFVEPIDTPISIDDRRRQFALQVALLAFNRRLQIISKNHPGKYGVLAAQLHNPTPYAQELTLTATGRNTDWQDVISVVIDEYRRLRRHGFHPEELTVPKTNVLHSAEFATEHGPTETAENYAGRIAQIILSGNTPTDTAFHLDLAREIVPEITPEQTMNALRPLFATGFPGLLLIAKYLEELPGEEVNAHLAAVLEHEVPPPLPRVQQDFPYQEFGEPGEIVERQHDEALDVHMVRFANGLRLNLKRTTYQQGTVHLTLRQDNGGRRNIPANRPGIDRVAQAALIPGGLEQIEWSAIQDALSGRFVNLHFHIGENTFNWGGRAEHDELPLLLQLTTAYLTEPSVRDHAVLQAGTNYISSLSTAQFNPQATINIYHSPLVYNNDARFRVPNQEQLNRLTIEQTRAWLRWLLPTGELELGLVGDMDIEAAIAHVAATLGALPPREPAPSADEIELRQITYIAKYRVQSQDYQAGLYIAWPGDHFATARERRTNEILGWVLQARIHKVIREKMGILYTPAVGRWSSDSDPSRGYLSTTLMIQSLQINDVYLAVIRIAEELAKGRISEEELQQAKAPLIDGVSQQFNSNPYWIRHVVSDAQTDPEALVMPHTRRHDLETISLREVKDRAKSFFGPQHHIAIVANPGG